MRFHFKGEGKKKKKEIILISRKEEGFIHENGEVAAAARVRMITCQGNELPSVDQSLIMVSLRVTVVDCKHVNPDVEQFVTLS